MSYGTTAIFIESYKTRQISLQKAAAFLLKTLQSLTTKRGSTLFKKISAFLQYAASIMKRVSFLTKKSRYYKMR